MASTSRDRERWLVAIDIAVKIGAVALLGWAIANPGLPQFEGKAFAARAIAYPLALVLVPIAWFVLGRARIPYPVLLDILFGLPFLIDVVGNALNLYDTIEPWDDLNHLVNWGLHTFGFGLLLRYGAWGRSTRIALAFEWAITTAVLWEFAELVTFVPNSPEAATAYGDTLLDVALGMAGGLIAAAAAARLPAQAVRSAGYVDVGPEVTA